MKIITVSREFGSGGREVGKRLADALGFKYYDKEIITEIAKQTNLHEEYINKTLENGLGFHFSFGTTLAGFSAVDQNAIDIMVAQRKIIKELAEKGDCVIVGRTSNVILKDYHPLNVFVYADMDSKVARCKARAKEEEKLTDKQYRKAIKKIDKGRAKYYSLLSSGKWGDKKEYDMLVNTTGMVIKDMIPALKEYAEAWFKTYEK